MCNKGPINAPINPINTGTHSSNSGSVLANVGNVGTLDNGGNATAVTHIEVHPPNPDLYNLEAKYEIYAAKSDKQMVIFVFCGVIFILLLILIARIIAWYCSREQERNQLAENHQTSDCPTRRSSQGNGSG